MKVRLTKIKSTHKNLHFDYYTGSCDEMPEVGKSFVMFTHQEGLLYTSPVLSYEVSFKDKEMTFETKNSTYKLTLLEN